MLRSAGARDHAGVAAGAARGRLEHICSVGYEATVLNDNTVRLAGLVIDIPPGPHHRSYAGVRSEVRQVLDGSWRVYLGDTVIATAATPSSGELRALRRRRRRPPSAAWSPRAQATDRDAPASGDSGARPRGEQLPTLWTEPS